MLSVIPRRIKNFEYVAHKLNGNIHEFDPHELQVIQRTVEGCPVHDLLIILENTLL